MNEPQKIYPAPPGPWPKGQAWYPLLGCFGPVNGWDLLPDDFDFMDDDTAWIHIESFLARTPKDYDPRKEWKTKDGRIIPIVEMTEDHLRNSLQMVWRNKKVVHPSLQLEWIRRELPPQGWMV